MASGNSLLIFTPLNNQPPASSYATLNVRNSHATLDFDAASNESALFGAVLPTHYAGGGLTVVLMWMAATATSGNVVWNAAIERHQQTTDDLDSDSFATAQAATAAAPGTSGQVQYTTITFTSGAQMDSLAAGESFRIKVTRDAANVSDTMAGDAQLLRAFIKET
ncbi:MAG: hypothetical protein IPO81_09515 [Kouleothrix sp.]|nr:hypothetical protein [Kouleothrix sp.]